MESYSQNSNKLDFQHEADIKRYMAHGDAANLLI